MTEKDKYYKDIAKAVKFFWNTKKTQLKASSDKSNRGAVVGGKQMDAFVGLIKQVAIDAGVPDSCIYTKNNYLPGFFRSSKDWDLLIISPSKKLIAAIELKSQIGSYGNNFNNRTEERVSPSGRGARQRARQPQGSGASVAIREMPVKTE